MNDLDKWRNLVGPVLFLLCLSLTGASGAAEPVAKPKAANQPVPKNAVDRKPTLAPWSDALFAQVEKEYGPQAAKRFRYVYDVARANQTKSIREKLDIANSTLNRLPWVSDQQQWNADDYWATPFEIIAKAGGDCEDMAIAKHVMLRMMGVPQRNLYLGYAQIRATNEIHMILVWANDQRTEARILDNKVKEVKLAKERMDLLVVFLTDATGNVILIDDDGTTRKVKAEVGHRKNARLEDIRQRIAETREKYRPYNDGKPLFND